MARVLISMPDELLERIDREARLSRSTRSAFLQEAARRRLGWPDPADIDAAVARGRAALEDAGSFDSTALVRAGRDALDRRRR